MSCFSKLDGSVARADVLMSMQRGPRGNEGGRGLGNKGTLVETANRRDMETYVTVVATSVYFFLPSFRDVLYK